MSEAIVSYRIFVDILEFHCQNLGKTKIKLRNTNTSKCFMLIAFADRAKYTLKLFPSILWVQSNLGTILLLGNNFEPS